MRTTARRIVRVLLVVVAVLAGLVVVVLIGLRSSWGRGQVAKLAEQQAERLLDVDISIGEIRGNLFSAPRLRDLIISRGGEPIISAERIDVRYDLRRVLAGEISVDSVTLTKPVIHLKEGPDRIALFDLFTRDATTPQGSPRAFDISPLVIVDGRVVIDPTVDDVEAFAMPDELRDLQARIGIERYGASTRITVEHLSFVGLGPRIVLQQLSGDVVFAEGDLAFDDVEVETADSQFTLDGSIQDVAAFGRSG